MDTRARLAAGGAVAVVLATVAVVIVAGLRPWPDLPTIADQPEPLVTGSLAYVDWEDRGPCLRVVSPRGETREVRCGDDLDQMLAWEDGRIVTHRWDPTGGTVVAIDPVTGDLTVLEDADVVEPDRGPYGDAERNRALHPDGRRLLVRSTDGIARLQVVAADGGEARTLLELTGPRRYEFQDPAWSADGQWVTVLDSGDRLIVLAADGSAPARIWTRDATFGAAVG